jgi:hypothetical protein
MIDFKWGFQGETNRHCCNETYQKNNASPNPNRDVRRDLCELSASKKLGIDTECFGIDTETKSHSYVRLKESDLAVICSGGNDRYHEKEKRNERNIYPAINPFHRIFHVSPLHSLPFLFLIQLPL